jgi:hypothetical protein
MHDDDNDDDDKMYDMNEVLGNRNDSIEGNPGSDITTILV